MYPPGALPPRGLAETANNRRRTLLIGATVAAAVLVIAAISYLTFAWLLGAPATTATPTSPVAAAAPATAAQVAAARPAPDAAAVLTHLQAAKIPGLRNGAVQDATNDPNQMMGRSTGYTSRASFDLPGGNTNGERYLIDRGGVIEVWASTEAAAARIAYIDAALQAAPLLGTEYHYQDGPVLVRVIGTVAPDVAAKVGAALAAM